MTQAARAELLATEAGQDAVRATLVSDVVRGYLSIGALDRGREIALRTLEGRRVAMDLQRQRLAAGVISELELRQLEASVAGGRGAGARARAGPASAGDGARRAARPQLRARSTK